MIKEFDTFVNRDRHEDNLIGDKYLGRSVLMLRDQKWRDMRSTLSPLYTSSKMKYMYGLLTECVDDFIKFHVDKASENSNEVEIETHDVFARITADGISTTALGFKGDCVRNKDSKIYEIAQQIEADFSNPTTKTILSISPKLFKLLGKQIFRPSIHDFFETNVLAEIQRRRDEKVSRPDVIQMLLQAKKGQLKLESGDAEELSYTESKVKKISNWTDEDLVAQALVLFLGGFETTAALMQCVSYELAMNADIQQILVKEVDEMLQQLDGKSITYDQLHQMKFLDMCVQESLRKWPPFRVTSRHCSKDCLLKDEETGRTFIVRKGVAVMIPIGCVMMDPKFFPNPDKFDPYRFSEGNKGNILSGSFLPFGLGPRGCIGSRYAYLEAKLLLFGIISKFTIGRCSKTPEKLTFSKGNIGFMEKIFVSFKLRK